MYREFERQILCVLPADEPEFVTLLENEGIFSEETKNKIHEPNQTKDDYAAFIMEEISSSVSDKNSFIKLLLVMKNYNYNLKSLVLKMEKLLNPSMYILLHA